MWFIGVEVEQETSAPPSKKILDPPLKLSEVFYFNCTETGDTGRALGTAQ